MDNNDENLVVGRLSVDLLHDVVGCRNLQDSLLTNLEQKYIKVIENP